MQLQTPYNAYVHATETSDSAGQIIMLYDAVINYIKQAKVAIKNNDHDTRYRLIDKAISVLHGLRLCLDFGACQEVAAAMDKYYDALDKLMMSVQCNQDENLCDAIIENLKTIRSTWEDINLQLKSCDNEEASDSSLKNSNMLI